MYRTFLAAIFSLLVFCFPSAGQEVTEFESAFPLTSQDFFSPCLPGTEFTCVEVADTYLEVYPVVSSFYAPDPIGVFQSAYPQTGSYLSPYCTPEEDPLNGTPRHDPMYNPATCALPLGPEDMLDGEEEVLEAGMPIGQLARLVGMGLARAGVMAPHVARVLGNHGERVVGLPKNTVPITISGKSRIPDGLSSLVISEVKNRASLAYYAQLRDFAAFAKLTGLRFDLYVRLDTVLTAPLQREVDAGRIHLIRVDMFAY